MTRSLMGVLGLLLALAQPALAPHQALAVVGFAMILASALVQLAAPRLSWVSVEESLSAIAGLLIVGALAGYSRQVGSMLVAEGIETEGEMEVLRRLGVPLVQTLVQGHYASRPGQPWPAVSPDVAGSAIRASTATARPGHAGDPEPQPVGAPHMVA